MIALTENCQGRITLNSDLLKKSMKITSSGLLIKKKKVNLKKRRISLVKR